MAGDANRRDAFVPGRVLVGLQAGAGAGERARRATAAAAAVGGRVVAGSDRSRVVELGQGADVRGTARRLASRPGVAFAEPDWIRRVDDCDPAVCWHLQPDPGANVVAANHGGSTGLGRTVAVVDTGVATGVADLAGRVTERWRCNPACSLLDPAQADTPADPQDPADPLLSSHGTEVASVVAANDDGAGTTGVAPGATIVSYRVDRTGGGIPISSLRSALFRIAADDDIDVANLSLGGSQWSAAEQEAVDAVLAAGKAVVASAGNTGDRVPQYPAAFPGMISVGASDADGQVAPFSSYGKVDVVAPGACVAVAEVDGFDQDRGCPGDASSGVAYNSGTSFAAPIVSGVLALAGNPSPLLARLALEASAGGPHPGGDAEAKHWAHGLADAAAFVASHQPDAPPSLVLETSAQDGDGGHRFGSGDGQLPHPSTTFVAYAFQAGGGLAGSPETARFAGVADGTAAFEAVEGAAGALRATLDSGPVEPGVRHETATATLDGTEAAGSVPVLVLQPDDQAPGVALVGSDDDAWRRLDSVDGDDLDDVYAVTLGKGDRLDAAIADLSGTPVAMLLFDAGTDDVAGRPDRRVACGGAEVGCPTDGLHFEAQARGTYLLDVRSNGSIGHYRLTWTVRNAASLPIEVTTSDCSPNGDGVQDRCVWTAGAVSGWTTSSFVTSGARLVQRQAGPGARNWDGRDGQGADSAPGSYLLRILYTEPGGRALLRAFVLTLDEDPPGIAAATVAPNPFEPRPGDGDRDTTAFAMTSTEPGRLRVIIYRHASSTVARVLVSGGQPAGRQEITWSGQTSSGAWLRGTFSFVIEAVDAAGNSSSSRRHTVRVL